MEVVKLRQDAGGYVYHLGTEKQARACPKAFEEGATAVAKVLGSVRISRSQARLAIRKIR
eukprot:8327521-Alexandrium_andersonii.AAC.1